MRHHSSPCRFSRPPSVDEPRSPAPPPARLRLPRTEHVAGRQLRGAVQAAGGRLPGVPAGLAALRHRGAGHAALAAQAGRRAADDAAHARLLFLESFLGNFLFSICMLFGVSMTSAVSAGVIMASIPAVVALAELAVPARAHHAAHRAGHRAARPSASACWRSRQRTARGRRGHARARCLAGQPAGVRRGAVRSGLCGHRQDADRRARAQAHHRRSSTSGASRWSTPFGVWYARCASTSAPSRRGTGCCCCSMRWPPASGRCGCG